MTGAGAYALALAAGAIATLAFPEPDVAPLAWVALAPLLVAARGAPLRRGLGLGLIYGFGFFGVLLYWQSLVGWLAWALLVTLQSLFIALFGGAWAVASRRSNAIVRIAVGAALWVAVEYLRSVIPLGGFTWGQLVQSQHDLTWFIRTAAWAGGWAVSLQVAVLNGLAAELWACIRARRTRLAPAYLGAVVAVVAAPAALPSVAAGGERARLALVQGNVERNFEGDFTDYVSDLVGRHGRLTAGLAGASPDLVVWPESAVALDPYRNAGIRRALTAAARAVDAPMLVGSELDIDESHRKVVVVHVARDGQLEGFYQKRHHVPFGEYIPLRPLFDWIPMLDQIPQDAVSGPGPEVFDLAGGPVATVISFEGDFGSLVRESMAAGGRLLVVATNTSTFGYTWNSAQHVAFSQIRAVENGVWVAHGALSGISAFIRPDGTVAASTPLWTATTLVGDVAFATRATFYARTGDWLPLGSALVALAGLAAGARRSG